MGKRVSFEKRKVGKKSLNSCEKSLLRNYCQCVCAESSNKLIGGKFLRRFTLILFITVNVFLWFCSKHNVSKKKKNLFHFHLK